LPQASPSSESEQKKSSFRSFLFVLVFAPISLFYDEY